MKLLKPALILGVLLFAFDAYSQAILIADNRPSRPLGTHVYAGLQAAIDAAVGGDIIHVIPSAVGYGTVTIAKSLTIYGIGFNPDKDGPQKAWVGNINITMGGDNTRISGINVSGAITLGTDQNLVYSVANIFIENGQIARILHNSGCCDVVTFSNVVVRNCVLGSGYSGNSPIISINNQASYFSVSNVLITNNIITAQSNSNVYAALYMNDGIVKNNLFLGNNTDDVAISYTNAATVSNNIFYGMEAYDNFVTNTVFNNNLSDLAATDPSSTFGNDFVNGGGSGVTFSGNITATDPVFTNVLYGNDWDFAYDPTTGAGAITGGGTDATDIGLFGSTIPFSMTGSPLPVIKRLLIPEIIKQGNNLNADIEAVGN